MTQLGYQLERATREEILLRRLTRESSVEINLIVGPKQNFRINTGLDFFNHMIETIAWRSGVNINALYQNTQFRLTHVIAEDVGIVLGKAFGELIKRNLDRGINCSGSKIGMIDEAMSIAALSFEGRASSNIDIKDSRGANREIVEDMLSDDLVEFFNGFAQGAGATVSIKVLSGENPHHTWESIFRAFGEALKECLQENTFRRGTTAGVKGTLE